MHAPEIPQKKRLVAYYRVSSESQEENNSIDLQKRKISWAADNYGFEIIANIEAVESATCQSDDRKHFKEALEIIRSANCDGLIVNDLDRFFRNTEEGLRIARKEFLESGKTLITLNQNIDISTDDGWFMFGVMLLFAEKEAKTNRYRMREGKRSKSRANKAAYLNGATPYGYKSAGPSGKRYLQIDPKEYPWREKIFSWRSEGRSYKWIAQELNTNGVKTKRGRQWRDTTVRIILIRPLALQEALPQIPPEIA